MPSTDADIPPESTEADSIPWADADLCEFDTEALPNSGLTKALTGGCSNPLDEDDELTEDDDSETELWDELLDAELVEIELLLDDEIELLDDDDAEEELLEELEEDALLVETDDLDELDGDEELLWELVETEL